MNHAKELTVYDIARQAGVSVATVSKVLNGHRGVNAQTAARVSGIVVSTGFRPRWRAQGNRCIGALLPPYSGILLDSYVSEIVSHCSDVLMAHDYSLQLLCPSKITSGGIAERGLGAEDLIEGAIAIASPPNYAFCRRLLANRAVFPCVVIGELDNDGPAANAAGAQFIGDDESAGYQLAMLMLRYNHRRFWLVGNSPLNRCHVHRLSGMRTALKTSGIPETAVKVLEVTENLRANGRQLAVSLACSPEKPDAVLFTNGTTCAGFVTGCGDMKLRIPEDLSVAGFEDGRELLDLPVPITSMHTAAEKIGTRAVEALLAQLEHRPLEGTGLVDYSLVMRQSVAVR